MLKQAQRLRLGEKKQDVILRDVVVCSDDVQAFSRQKCHRRDQVEGDPDHMLRFLGGACEGILDGGFMALERSRPCISLRWLLSCCSRIDNLQVTTQ